ncbi:uncharacterized protein METZ01_LOCUS52779 [marine metagenome]|uniref:Uncharacterized protein n=1 Tax=marine metagenome TaxID=408172 RepID=A0A381S748_9ZZZZ|tara:strand:+ start:281 stop:439 length:159 start_codon:yes stop_codon:yes gene_type:complete
MSTDDEYQEKKKAEVKMEIDLDYHLECERREWLVAYYADLNCPDGDGIEMYC